MSTPSSPVMASTGSQTRMVLPRPSPVRATFRKESWGDAVVKIFKKEIQTAKILQDAEKVRKLLASRTKLYRMQQAVIFFMLLFIIGLFCYQVVQVAMNGGNRLDHRIEPLPRIDFRNMLKKKEEQQ